MNGTSVQIKQLYANGDPEHLHKKAHPKNEPQSNCCSKIYCEGVFVLASKIRSSEILSRNYARENKTVLKNVLPSFQAAFSEPSAARGRPHVVVAASF